MQAFGRQVRFHIVGSTLAVAMLVGCGSEPSAGPEVEARSSEMAVISPENRQRPVDLGVCDSLAVPNGAHMLAHLYAKGDQILFWEGTQWLFLGPDAVLFADQAGQREVVHQVAGVWESRGGSKVVGQVQRGCTADPSAIPWQLLSALGRTGPGLFARVDYIQRLRTQGGLAPTAPGAAYGEQQRVAYSAEYLFYRNGR